MNVHLFSFSLKKFCENAANQVGRENAQKAQNRDSVGERSFLLPTFAAAAKQFLLICANRFALFHSRVNILFKISVVARFRENFYHTLTFTQMLANLNVSIFYTHTQKIALFLPLRASDNN